jgi:hypothetical protein
MSGGQGGLKGDGCAGRPAGTKREGARLQGHPGFAHAKGPTKPVGHIPPAKRAARPENHSAWPLSTMSVREVPRPLVA